MFTGVSIRQALGDEGIKSGVSSDNPSELIGSPSHDCLDNDQRLSIGMITGTAANQSQS